MMKHLLFLMRTRSIGGAERRVVNLFRTLDHSAFRVTWAVKENVYRKMIGPYHIPLRVIELPVWKDGSVKRFVNAFGFFKSLSPDLIVFHQFWLRSFRLAEIIAAHLVTKGKVLMFVHSYSSRESNHMNHLSFQHEGDSRSKSHSADFFIRMMAYFCKDILVVSEDIKRSLINDLGYPGAKIAVAYNGVDTVHFSPDPFIRRRLRENLRIPLDDTVFISTARFVRVKRLERLVGAFKTLSEDRNNVRLLLVGDGPLVQEIKDLVRSEGMGDRVQFFGFVNDVAPLLQASDVYVLPSDSEGFSNGLMEAMSCGLICISTRSGGIEESLTAGHNGFVVDRSEQGILEGLKKALSLPEGERERISRNARNCILDHFNMDDRTERMLTMMGLR